MIKLTFCLMCGLRADRRPPTSVHPGEIRDPGLSSRTLLRRDLWKDLGPGFRRGERYYFQWVKRNF